MLDKISCWLDGWKKIFLSFGGRITLVQSCFSFIPAYFLLIFKVPIKMANKIEKLQRDFLWSSIGESKRDHLARWDLVCKPKGLEDWG